MATYTLPRALVPTQCGLINSPYYAIARSAKEVETFDTFALEAYFQSGKGMFEQSLQNLFDLCKPFTKRDQSELAFMLESLMHARSELDAVENIIT
jgi:hypothetical protein